ncbi:hypothetical protein CP532_0969 [Ophiocordyceps camponoti-leonardi (nom. inval.)]|nr:hypothetical protein CP532_0969 [Ophiocordyceps camponoti-leonardi (nom. inval.)]
MLSLRGPAYHQRLLPAHKQLKYRQAGQGGDADDDGSRRDLAAELLAAEAEAAAARRPGGKPLAGLVEAVNEATREADDENGDDEGGNRRSDGDDGKRQRDEARAQAEAQERERSIALGNPLLNKQDFSIKRRWDDDVVFKNQARGTEEKGKKKEFVNDLLRSDFHRRFMSKYVR